MAGVKAYTIGHSSRPIGEFVERLDEHAIRLLVDVRRYPGSRQHPQFNRESLAQSLTGHGIAYRHAPELGGRRRTLADSVNTAWRSSGFRGYADWMASPEFQAGLARLVADIGQGATVLMCAEAMPWKCHRFLLADALVARAIEVVHILGTGSVSLHELHADARVDKVGIVTYPADDPQIGLL
jgi:uncharacterized protein (DUF488 family)